MRQHSNIRPAPSFVRPGTRIGPQSQLRLFGASLSARTLRRLHALSDVMTALALIGGAAVLFFSLLRF